MDPANHLSALFGLTGRTAVVTGGSSGIGLAIARSLAGAGARVVLVARDEQRLADARAALVADGHDIVTVAADVGTDDGLDIVVDAVRAAFDGDPDILVNSAGVNLRPPMIEVDDATWDTTMAVNLRAPEVLSRRFAPGMIARGYGRLIHISSQQAHRAFATSGVYGVSKGGLESLSRSQAEAWSAHGVTSNTLVPGFVMTRLNERLSADPETVAALAARTMVGRNGLADDFAAAAVFLAGPGSGYVTGSSLFVDGGLSAH